MKKANKLNLFSQQYHFSITDLRLTQISLAYDNTFLLLGDFLGQQDSDDNNDTYVMQYSSKGKLLHKFYIGKNILSFKMFTDDEIIFTNQDQSAVNIWSLRTYQKKIVKYPQIQAATQPLLFIFPETKLFCLIQDDEDSEEDKQYTTFRVNYYKYCGINGENQHIIQIEKHYDIQFSLCQQLNHASKISWCLQTDEHNLCYCFLELDSNMNLKFQQFPVPKQKLAKKVAQWIPIWQLTNGKYIAALDLDGSGLPLFQAAAHRTLGLISFDRNKKRINKQKILLGSSYENLLIGFNLQMCLSNCIIIQGSIIKSIKDDYPSQYHTFLICKQTGNLLQSERNSIYHDNEVILSHMDWNNKLFFSTNNRQIYDCQQKLHRGSIATVTLYHSLIDSTVEPKDIFMFFLLQQNEDFDDDLLMDAIELLQSDEQ